MNIIPSSFMRFRGLHTLSRGRTGIQQLTAEHVGYPGFKQQGFYRSFSSWFVSSTAARPLVSRHPGPLSSQAEGSGVIQLPLWQYQQIRTRKRGTEYQPKNIKRKRTHGWIKRLSTRGGIEVILRRMLKGRKSLTH